MSVCRGHPSRHDRLLRFSRTQQLPRHEKTSRALHCLLALGDCDASHTRAPRAAEDLSCSRDLRSGAPLPRPAPVRQVARWPPRPPSVHGRVDESLSKQPRPVQSHTGERGRVVIEFGRRRLDMIVWDRRIGPVLPRVLGGLGVMRPDLSSRDRVRTRDRSHDRHSSRGSAP